MVPLVGEMAKKTNAKGDEPVMLVRPAVKSLGLDYLHVSLIVLVIILVGLAFALSRFSNGSPSCGYGLSANGICASPAHNSTQALDAAEQVLANYALINSSLALLPYYSLPQEANVTYLPNQGKWLVVMPYIDPLLNNTTLYFSMMLYDSNLSLSGSFVQTVAPATASGNRVVAFGAVAINGKSSCVITPNTTMPVYAFIDPYAPGAIQGMIAGINASSRYGQAVNISYKFISTGFEKQLYNGYGVNRTAQVPEDLWCASLQQSRFLAFLSNYSILYQGTPLDNSTLASIAQGSGLNMSAFASCLGSAPQKLYLQGSFANYYGITTTPTYVVNCHYQTIPQTLNAAIQYSINQTK